MSRWQVAPLVLVACAGPAGSVGRDVDAGSPPDTSLRAEHSSNADSPEGGPAVADAVTCRPVAIPAAFTLTKVADAKQLDTLPSIHLGHDGAPRLLFLDRGELGNLSPTLMAAQLAPATEAGTSGPARIVALASGLFPWTAPRAAATRTGQLRVVYIAWAGPDTSVARYLSWSGDWQEPPVDSPVGPELTAATPDIVLDQSDQPVLSLVYSDFSLRLLTPGAGGGWRRETVEFDVNPFDTVMSIGFDRLGRTFVAASIIHFEGTLQGSLLPGWGGVTVWSRTPSGWSRQVLDIDGIYTGVRAWRGPSGEATIFGWDGVGVRGLSRFSHPLAPGDAEWRTETPLQDRSRTYLTGLGSVALGSGGEIHVAYQSREGRITYAVFNGCDWSQVVVDGNGQAVSIVLDASSNPHIAYEKGGVGDAAEVWYATPR